ncbi:hypothetical protein [Lacrimispora brassicae]
MTDSEKLELLLQAVTNIKSDMQEVKADMQGVKADMQGVKADMQGVKSDMQGVKSDMQEVKSDMQEVKSDMQEVKTDIAILKKKVSVIELTLENEISHNIMVIAEGHLDLNRKLDEAIHLTSDIKAKQEIQDLYIKRHDNKLRAKEIS